MHHHWWFSALFSYFQMAICSMTVSSWIQSADAHKPSSHSTSSECVQCCKKHFYWKIGIKWFQLWIRQKKMSKKEKHIKSIVKCNKRLKSIWIWLCSFILRIPNRLVINTIDFPLFVRMVWCWTKIGWISNWISYSVIMDMHRFRCPKIVKAISNSLLEKFTSTPWSRLLQPKERVLCDFRFSIHASLHVVH